MASNERGFFSVRSSYHMIMKLKRVREDWIENEDSTSGMDWDCPGWSAVWQTKVPSKLHAFAWRLPQNSIPTRDVLHHRNMASTHVCALCGSLDSWRHSMPGWLEASRRCLTNQWWNTCVSIKIPVPNIDCSPCMRPYQL